MIELHVIIPALLVVFALTVIALALWLDNA